MDAADAILSLCCNNQGCIRACPGMSIFTIMPCPKERPAALHTVPTEKCTDCAGASLVLCPRSYCKAENNKCCFVMNRMRP